MMLTAALTQMTRKAVPSATAAPARQAALFVIRSASSSAMPTLPTSAIAKAKSNRSQFTSSVKRMATSGSRMNAAAALHPMILQSCPCGFPCVPTSAIATSAFHVGRWVGLR
jgi:hypothetical protein